LTLEQIEDHCFQIGRFDVGFTPGAAVAAKIVNDEIHILIVVIRDDRGRPIGPTHNCNSNATETTN
jgi:hypothetical protein